MISADLRLFVEWDCFTLRFGRMHIDQNGSDDPSNMYDEIKMKAFEYICPRKATRATGIRKPALCGRALAEDGLLKSMVQSDT